MAGQLKIGGNVIATHAGSEGAGTVTLDSSTLTIGSNTTIQGTMNAGTIGTGVTINAGSNVSGIGQLVGVSYAPDDNADTDGNDVTVDPNKNYIIWVSVWYNDSSSYRMEVWTATGNGTSHTYAHLAPNVSSGLNVAAGAGGNGYLRYTVNSSFSYGSALVFEQGTGIDIT
jgi:hypothetical protein